MLKKQSFLADSKATARPGNSLYSTSDCILKDFYVSKPAIIPKSDTQYQAKSTCNSEKNETKILILHTFNSIGWPVIQSGLSTILGIIPLIFVDAYVVDVFWKTIILVTLLGMFHALFLLPFLFICLSELKVNFRRNNSKFWNIKAQKIQPIKLTVNA